MYVLPHRRFRAAAAAGTMAALSVLFVSAATAVADPSLTVGVSSNPTQGIASTITVTGSSNVADNLFVYLSSGAVYCAGVPVLEADSGAAVSSPVGDPIAAASFSKQYKYTPPTAGDYTVCAYIDANPDAEPVATQMRTFAARAPTGSASIQVGAKPTEGVASRISVTGSSEVAAGLYVYLNRSAVPCAQLPAAEATLGSSEIRLSKASGDPVGPGHFSKHYEYAPPTNGAYAVCAYVDDAPEDPPYVSKFGGFRARRAAASTSIRIAGTPTAGEASTITVSGSSGAPQRLYVYLGLSALAHTSASFGSHAGRCGESPVDEVGTDVVRLSGAGGDRIGSGTFSKRYRYMVPSVGRYTVCAYVDNNTSEVPGSHRSAVFTYAGIGLLPPKSPGADCNSPEGQLPLGTAAAIAAIDFCRAGEGIGPLVLPSNWARLTIPEQLLVVINLERVNRGLAPVIGLSRTLDRFALGGAQRRDDPTFPSQPAVLVNMKPAYTAGGSIWAGVNSTLLADYGWMYHDGYGTAGFINIDCSSPKGPGCWGHRDNILSDDDLEPAVGGGAAVHASDAFEQLYGYRTSDLVFRWSNELRYFAHRPTVEPLKPR